MITELNLEEMEQVDGGALLILGLAVASGIGLGLTIYTGAKAVLKD